MTVAKDLLELARELAGLRDRAEHAAVVYEDGSVLHLRGTPFGVGIPLVSDHGRAVAVVHTHPVPRTAPSLPDLQVLISMARLGVPSPKLATVYSDGVEATVSVYTLRGPPPPELLRLIEEKAMEYEALSVESRFDSSVSEKQLREQAAVLGRLGISVERYRFRLHPEQG